jgi:hypothetical protein
MVCDGLQWPAEESHGGPEPHGPNRNEPMACIADDDMEKIYRDIVYRNLGRKCD